VLAHDREDAVDALTNSRRQKFAAAAPRFSRRRGGCFPHHENERAGFKPAPFALRGSSDVQESR
jgi:hypothetical protein